MRQWQPLPNQSRSNTTRDQAKQARSEHVQSQPFMYIHTPQLMKRSQATCFLPSSSKRLCNRKCHSSTIVAQGCQHCHIERQGHALVATHKITMLPNQVTNQSMSYSIIYIYYVLWCSKQHVQQWKTWHCYNVLYMCSSRFYKPHAWAMNDMMQLNRQVKLFLGKVWMNNIPLSDISKLKHVLEMWAR